MAEFRIAMYGIHRLVTALQIPVKITCFRRPAKSNIEGICILIKRLVFPCQLTDVISIFGRNPTKISPTFKYVLDFICSQRSPKVSAWIQNFQLPNQLSTYANAVHLKGAPLSNCFDFIDGAVIPISRPNSDLETLYNDSKRIHAIKFQSLALPNGLMGSFSGPYDGRNLGSTTRYHF